MCGYGHNSFPESASGDVHGLLAEPQLEKLEVTATMPRGQGARGKGKGVLQRGKGETRERGGERIGSCKGKWKLGRGDAKGKRGNNAAEMSGQ